MRLIDADKLLHNLELEAYHVRDYINGIERGMTLTGLRQIIDEAQTIDPYWDVLEIVDKATSDYEAMPTEIDVGREKAFITSEKKDGMLAMASMIRVLILALKGGEDGKNN